MSAFPTARKEQGRVSPAHSLKCSKAGMMINKDHVVSLLRGPRQRANFQREHFV